MKTSSILYQRFNRGLETRRAKPMEDGGPDLEDVTNVATALIAGVADLGYRHRNGLALQCHFQGDDDVYWISESLESLAYHLGCDLLPGVDDLRGCLPDTFVDQQTKAFYSQSMKLIAKAQAVHDALSEHGIAPENAAWFSDDSSIFHIAHEFLRLFKDAQQLESLPQPSRPFRVRNTTVPLCSIP
jgi:hypothetical protein